VRSVKEPVDLVEHTFNGNLPLGQERILFVDDEKMLADQTMPIMDGARLSIEMMQIRPNLPIVLCTGYSSVMSEKRAKDLGVKELVQKPLRTKEIAQIIRKVLDE